VTTIFVLMIWVASTTEWYWQPFMVSDSLAACQQQTLLLPAEGGDKVVPKKWKCVEYKLKAEYPVHNWVPAGGILGE
jgi:hypothetical protein